MLLAVALLIGISNVVVAGQISGSAHDFAVEDWTGGKICIACHAPHHTDTSTIEAPLWNHAVTVAVFNLYASATLDATISQPGGSSKLCLSCHDGTVAINSFGGVTGAEFLSPPKSLTTNLANDHPIGFTYDTALVTADGALHPTSNPANIGSGGQVKTGTIESNLLFNGRMECSSCHDVHNTFTADTGDALIKITQDGSTLCLTCHNK